MKDYNDDSLNRLLAEVCKLLQLSLTQHESATDKYEAVGGWLGGPGSPLEHLATSIYPQGSMALGTTVKPGENGEHDLDLIFEVEHFDLTALDLHRIVEARLKENKLYNERIVRPAPPRCIRLKYAGDFHLDIVPARKDPARGLTAIEVPDRNLQCWVPNNPIEYQNWFELRCASLIITEKAAVQPVPGLVPSDQKPPLKRAVQLIKRHRDIVLGHKEGAPSSIMLTTMAARLYCGEARVVDTLAGILARAEIEIRSAWPGRVSVPNPTNLAEDLASKFSNEQYANFAQWVVAFNNEVYKLVQVRGLDKIATVLKSLFGEKVTTSVVKSYMQRLAEVRKAGQLRYGDASGLSVTGGLVVPVHTFHGEN